jgi:hypothetical protein
MADTYSTGTCSSTITRTKNYGTLAKKVACRMLGISGLFYLCAFLSWEILVISVPRGILEASQRSMVVDGYAKATIKVSKVVEGSKT